MTPITENTSRYILADTENAQITLSETSKKLNEELSASKSTQFITVADMERGKFRRRFDYHRTAYRFFN